MVGYASAFALRAMADANPPYDLAADRKKHDRQSPNQRRAGATNDRELLYLPANIGPL
jgi:hypothetical protein